MHPHLLRQVRDIQFQADKLLKSKPGIIEVNHYAKYAEEINNYLLTHIDLKEIHQLVNDIPSIQVEEEVVEKTLLATLTPGFMLAWFRDRQKVDKALEAIDISKGKYASIEFILKNFLD